MNPAILVAQQSLHVIPIAWKYSYVTVPGLYMAEQSHSGLQNNQIYNEY